MASSRPQSTTSLAQVHVLSKRTSSSSYARPVTDDTAYTYALRTALLTHLIQPRSRRLQHVPAPVAKSPLPPQQRSSLSINELVKDFSHIRDSKSTKLPNGFTNELDKRITGVLVGKEKMPEFQDALVKRTFATFLNAFKDPSFRKGVEKDRRVEDLLLIFFSKATSELQKGKPADDDAWKLMVDRHVALFVRLISSTLKTGDWARERTELSSRLQVMEQKLLAHSQDLADDLQRNGGAGGSTVEVEVPVSYAVKDMPAALRVGTLFMRSYDQMQADIDANKDSWTAEAALRDLKIYHMLLNVNSRQTLNAGVFTSQDAYDAWKKAEIHELSHMMLTIIKVYPQLAKTSTGQVPSLQAVAGSADSGFSEPSRHSTLSSPEDMHTALDSLSIASSDHNLDRPDFVFMPPDPRACLLTIMRKVLANDLAMSDEVVSIDSTAIIAEVAFRWRVPLSSRRLLLFQAAQDLYVQHAISLETLDTVLSVAKESTFDLTSRKPEDTPEFFDRSSWISSDQSLIRLVTQQLHDAMLAEVLEIMQHCYESKPPSVGPAIYVLEHHVYTEPSFTVSGDDVARFKGVLTDALSQRAREAYNSMITKNIPEDGDQWTFLSVVQLGQAVHGLEQKIQKRYRNNSEVMGVNPLVVFVQAVLPPLSKDASHIVKRIIDSAASREEELAIQDGFDLYREMVTVRDYNHDIVSLAEWDFDLESTLAQFIWRWLANFDDAVIGWVENAVKQDRFETVAQPGDDTPTDQERHSVSAMDIFRIFDSTVKQILDLRWGDDLQHAKFMTALAKSIGAGVARYSEILEQSFMKEMDRPTLEQETIAEQSRQEKWVQLAKEAILSERKVEPYQFAPETLVKLNDIEHTTLRFDEIEKMMDVGVCAEKLKQHEPIVRKQRKAMRYVFTIKIIEAEDLKACDSNGLSDPYVVIGDEYQKRLAKTRIIYANLNPRWDEKVDIITTGPLHIVATIWDWDSLGDHDCVGRTSLKLDPAHFGDFLPREFWLDLDTQGRLLLRISMEGERDDIEFYFGKAFRTLKRVEKDMTRKVTDKLSQFIQQSLSRRTLRNMLGQGLSMSSVKAFAGGFASSYLSKMQQQLPAAGPAKVDAAAVLSPLFTYFDENFAIMKQTLTDAAMISVMTRVWKETLTTIEALLVPALSDKPSLQRSLGQQEVDIVYKWLQMLFEFFNAEGEGVPLDILRSPKYHDLQNLNFFYFESTDNLIRTSENMASATWARQKNVSPGAREPNRFSAPSTLSSGMAASGLFGVPSTRRSKTIMMSRNLGTMRQAKANKRKDAQAEPSDDMILRILRMRPEAERYLRDRSRQRERLAAQTAAEQIVKQSILASRRPIAGMQRRQPSMQ